MMTISKERPVLFCVVHRTQGEYAFTYKSPRPCRMIVQKTHVLFFSCYLPRKETELYRGAQAKFLEYFALNFLDPGMQWVNYVCGDSPILSSEERYLDAMMAHTHCVLERI